MVKTTKKKKTKKKHCSEQVSGIRRGPTQCRPAPLPVCLEGMNPCASVTARIPRPQDVRGICVRFFSNYQWRAFSTRLAVTWDYSVCARFSWHSIIGRCWLVLTGRWSTVGLIWWPRCCRRCQFESGAIDSKLPKLPKFNCSEVKKKFNQRKRRQQHRKQK